MVQQSWSLRLETSGMTIGYETALMEICGAVALSVSRPYLDAPYWVIEGFFDSAPDKALAEQALQAASETGEIPAFEIIDYGKRDWLAENRASFPALHIGRFWIYGAHVEQAPPLGAIKLHVEAAEAFGSGTHPTTEGCLRAIDRLLQKKTVRSVLDLGAGSAILAMSVAKAQPKASIIAADIDPIATRTATDNRRLNHIAPHTMTCVTSKGFAHRTLHQAAPYDLLIANILAGPLKALAGDIRQHLSADGCLILSGLLIAQEPQIIASYRARGLVVRKRIHIDEWSCLVLTHASYKGVI